MSEDAANYKAMLGRIVFNTEPLTPAEIDEWARKLAADDVALGAKYDNTVVVRSDERDVRINVLEATIRAWVTAADAFAAGGPVLALHEAERALREVVR